MGKRGQAKKACQYCTRRKIRCDLEECKKNNIQQCTSCQRRNKECIEIGKEKKNDETLEHYNVDASNIPLSSSEPGFIAYRSIAASEQSRESRLPSTPGDNIASSQQIVSIQTYGVKCLDERIVKISILDFFSSQCFLSRILLHWKSLLLEYVQLLPSLDSMDPICLLIEAIICYGITLNRETAIKYLPTRTALTQHLKNSLEKVLMNDSTELNIRKSRDMNAILASCTILFDVWLNAGVYCPDSLLPKRSNGTPIFHKSILRIPVEDLECPTRLLEMILFDMGGIGSNSKDDVGDCSNNLMLYWYIYLIDAFSVAFPERYPFIHQDTINLLKRKQSSYGFRKKQFSMNSEETEADKRFAKILISLSDLANVWWQIGSLWKIATADRDFVSYVEFQEVLQSLRLWENDQKFIETFAHNQDPIEYCIILLNKYGYLKIYALAKQSCVLDRTDVNSRMFAYEIQENSLKAWYDIVHMMEQLEKLSMENLISHSLLSQSRIMISCMLDCIEWSLQRLSNSEARENEIEAILTGSERLLQITNRFGDQDAFLGLDTLDALSQMEQIVHQLRMKNSQQRAN